MAKKKPQKNFKTYTQRRREAGKKSYRKGGGLKKYNTVRKETSRAAKELGYKLSREELNFLNKEIYQDVKDGNVSIEKIANVVEAQVENKVFQKLLLDYRDLTVIDWFDLHDRIVDSLNPDDLIEIDNSLVDVEGFEGTVDEFTYNDDWLSMSQQVRAELKARRMDSPPPQYALTIREDDEGNPVYVFILGADAFLEPEPEEEEPKKKKPTTKFEEREQEINLLEKKLEALDKRKEKYKEDIKFFKENDMPEEVEDVRKDLKKLRKQIKEIEDQISKA